MTRPQVFISSTFEDLRNIRHELLLKLCKMRCIPEGMELFGPRGNTPLNTIYESIKLSHLYVLIIAGRYGSVEPNYDLSYTELEYEYANKILGSDNVLCLIHAEPNKLAADQTETDKIRKNKLKNFIEKVKKQSTIHKWNNEQELTEGILQGFVNWRSENINVGWVHHCENTFENPNSVIDSLQFRIVEKAIPDNILHTIIKSNTDGLIKQLRELRNKNIEVPTHQLYEQIVKIVASKVCKEYYMVDHAIFRWNELHDSKDSIPFNTFNYSSTILARIVARQNEAGYSLKRLFLVSKANAEENINSLIRIVENINDNLITLNEQTVQNRFLLTVPTRNGGVHTAENQRLKDLNDIVIVKKDDNTYIKFTEAINFDSPVRLASDTKSSIELIEDPNMANSIISDIEGAIEKALTAKDFLIQLNEMKNEI